MVGISEPSVVCLYVSVYVHNCALIIGKFKEGVIFVVVFEDYKFKCCKLLWVCFGFRVVFSGGLIYNF